MKAQSAIHHHIARFRFSDTSRSCISKQPSSHGIGSYGIVNILSRLRSTTIRLSQIALVATILSIASGVFFFLGHSWAIARDARPR